MDKDDYYEMNKYLMVYALKYISKRIITFTIKTTGSQNPIFIIY
jgi:hypothetical protein